MSTMDHLKVKVHHVKRKLSGQDSAVEHNGRFILITNGTSYVSTWIIRQFLSNGYQVRTTVGSNIEAQDVRDTLSMYAHNLETVVVTKATGYDEAVKGIDGVVCTKLEEWQPLLEAVVKEAPKVQRVVVTSSLDAAKDSQKPSQPERVDSAGEQDTPSEESALRAFIQEKNPNLAVAIVCLAMVWGPLAHKTDLDGVSSSSDDVAEIWRTMNGEGTGNLRLPAFVDVRNVAQAHFRAYEREVEEDETEERYIVSSGPVTYAQLCSTLKVQAPEWRLNIPNPDKMDDQEPTHTFDNTQGKEVLCMSFIGLEDCLRDTAQSLVEIQAAGKKGLRYDGQEWFRHV